MPNTVLHLKSANPDFREVENNSLTPSTAILLCAERPETIEAYLAEALPFFAHTLGGDFVAVLQPGERIRTVTQLGLQQTWPTEIVSSALDQESVVVAGAWIAAPLAPRQPLGEVLLVHRPEAVSKMDRATTIGAPLQSMVDALGAGLRIVRQRQRLTRRTSRTETILSIVQQWSRTQEMESLLVQIAEASLHLLTADRASIFLWDRSSHMLVARPALGVPDRELRVPDDVGVVGEVLRSGQPRRVSPRETHDPVNRRIDATLGYQTETLLAVPLRTSKGEMLGVFEAINKRTGEFTDDDEAALVELAAHATMALEDTQDWQRLLTSHRVMVDQAAEHVRLIGESPIIKALRSTVGRVADTDLAVLVLGENGTGKEVVSQMIHYLSHRRDRPFVAVNCAAIAESLLESELFGHEKGAFTDAHDSRQGKFELADGGTLLLDEIGELSPAGQAKLLRVLEEKIIVRVGGSRPIQVDVRVIAATNKNLADMVRAKKFRQDLYYRLNVVVLDLPPLRDRGHDVLLLAEHFLADYSKRARRRPPKLAPEARQRLLQHSWPGNVREIRNLMERLAFLAPEDTVQAVDLSFILAEPNDSPGLLVVDQTLADATDRFQIEYIKKAIQRTDGNMSSAADMLGLHRSNLYRKMKQLGMEE